MDVPQERHVLTEIPGPRSRELLARRVAAVPKGGAPQRPDARRPPEMTMLANSGAEAVENAVKVARYFTGRPAIVTFDHGFHGRHKRFAQRLKSELGLPARSPPGGELLI